MLIDFHTHVFPDAIAGRAIAKMEAISGVAAHTRGSVAELEASMPGQGIDLSVNMPVITDPAQTASINAFAAGLNKREKMRSFAGLHPASPDWRAQLDAVVAAGFKGVKFHPDYQGFFLNDPAALEVIAAVMDRGLAVLVHAGFDPLSPTVHHCPPKMIADILPSLPDGVFIAAHFGGFRYTGDALKYLAGTKVYIDASFSFKYDDPAACAEILRRHSPARILFGSDSPWDAPADAAAFLRSVGLGQEAEDLIFYKNAQRILGME
ncbi:MAG: amidohydrolase family protein [Oscillospiraceae bacterium]|nr:amidohydrolase family protein [Oscillospiraceae bacterium]